MKCTTLDTLVVTVLASDIESAMVVVVETILKFLCEVVFLLNRETLSSLDNGPPHLLVSCRERSPGT